MCIFFAAVVPHAARSGGLASLPRRIAACGPPASSPHIRGINQTALLRTATNARRSGLLFQLGAGSAGRGFRSGCLLCHRLPPAAARF